MAVTLTALGSTLVVSVLDDNFETLQDLFRSGILRTDFTGQFDRYHLLRYTGGKLVSASASSHPLLNQEHWKATNVDMTFRYGKDDNTYTGAQGVWDAAAADPADGWDRQAMELLGRPGPSLYYQWQEDGLDEAVVMAGVAGWPPAYWPINRYPAHLCFSPWLTIPGASVRVYVDEPCVARLHGTARGALNFSTLGRYTQEGAANGAMPTVTGYVQQFIDDEVNRREFFLYRLGLIADTNPKLYADEFTNTNINIVDPAAGTTAPYVSWRVVKEKGFYAAQRQEFKLAAEVALKGRRWYNFSFKYRDGGIRGWVRQDIIAGPTWDPGIWGVHANTTNDINEAPLWRAARDLTYPPPAGFNYRDIGALPQMNLWESGSINVELHYGRSTAYSIDSSAAEFTSKPT